VKIRTINSPRSSAPSRGLVAFAVLGVVTALISVASPPSTARAQAPARASAASSVSQTSFAPNARIEDDDPSAVFVGGWRFVSTSAASGGTHRLATSPGAIARIRFRGTGVALISRLAPGAGRIAISLDGGPSATIDLSSTVVTQRARVWTASGLARRLHSVTVRAIETSPATEWKSVVVDAFQIAGTAQRTPASGQHQRIEESDRRIRYMGSWTNRARMSAASRGRASTANHGGARAIVAFSGTGISWLAPNQRVGARAQVILDGHSYGYVRLNRAGARGAQRVMWSIGGLSRGRHTLEVRAVAASSAKSKVVIDVFDVVGTVLDARPMSSMGFSWRNYIVVDKSEFRLYLVKNGIVERTYPVAHGKLGWATPVATWRVDAKYYTGGVSGPRKMRLFRQKGGGYIFTAYGIHGTNEPWVIGSRASHGCIRLYNDDVLDLFPRVPLGTMVVTRD
jgi:hypothetical protein